MIDFVRVRGVPVHRLALDLGPKATVVVVLDGWGHIEVKAYAAAEVDKLPIDPPADAPPEPLERLPLPKAPARLGVAGGVRSAPRLVRRLHSRGRVRRSYTRSQVVRHLRAVRAAKGIVRC